jgi:tetratricopeptide (TPR) repeat protein
MLFFIKTLPSLRCVLIRRSLPCSWNTAGRIYDAYIDRSAAYARKGDFARAIADADNAIKTYNFDSAYANRAEIYVKMGNFNKAVSGYMEAIKIQKKEAIWILEGPEKAKYYRKIALVYQDKGDAKNADKYLRKAQEMDPEAKPAEESIYRSNFMDRNGSLILDNDFDEVLWFKHDLAAVKSGGAWGYIGKTAQIAVKPVFESVPPEFPATGLALVKRAGKYGYIDRTGTFVIEPRYDAAYDFTEGLAAVKVGTRWGYID